MTVVKEADIRKPHETLQERLTQAVDLLERDDRAVQARESQGPAPGAPTLHPPEGLVGLAV